MGGPGVEWTSAGWSAPAPQPLTHPAERPWLPQEARVFSCALSKRKRASWRLHKTGSRSTARRTTVPYIVEFRTAEGDALAISIPRTEAAVIRHFQAKMPYGLVVPDVKAD